MANIQRLVALRASITSEGEQLALDFPHWKDGIDARLTLPAKLAHSLRNAELTTVFTGTCLVNPDWWTREYGGDGAPGAGNAIVDAFMIFARFGFLHQYLADVESSFRILYRALAPNKESIARGSFRQLSNRLLTDELSGFTEWLPLMTLMRNVRNTLHNNGLAFPIDGKDVELEWQNQRYHFVDGAHASFITWTFLIDRARDLWTLCGSVLRASPVTALRLIPDPAAVV